MVAANQNHKRLECGTNPGYEAGMTLPTAHVAVPDITVDAQGTARSAAFGDVYFSAMGGVEETRHVFLNGNGLPARWLETDTFTVGELGLGTGLNFLVTWQAFLESGAPGQLHYVAVEQYPLTREQFVKALAHYPALARYATQLADDYPLRLPGVHRITFERVTLTLAIGDAGEMLPQLSARVDAWYLDGFTPAKNAAMWSDSVLQQVARLSAPHATLATFTVAGAVRRGLEAAGFAVEKTKGFAHKREMLVGKKISLPERGAETLPAPPVPAAADAIVIGAGIAGCSVARALAQRGMRVTLVEKHAVGSGASGNRAAVLYPQLTQFYTPATAWHFTAYGFVLRALARWRREGLAFAFAQPGMLKIAKDDEDEARLRRLRDRLQLDAAIARWVEADEASQLLHQPVPRGGFWFVQGTWLAPAELSAALVQHANITYRHATVARLAPGRVVLDSGEVLTAAQIVLANAQDAPRLLPEPLLMGISAGQVSYARGASLAAILCHQGYAINHPTGLLIGATYDRTNFSTAVTNANHAHNLEVLAQALPDFPPPAIEGGRTALRATTPQRLPYVGRWGEGLWLSVGHGSRGMLSAPLAAELIAAQLCGEPWPVTQNLARLVGRK